MNILFWGTPNYSVKSLNSLANSEHEIIGVVTQPDRRRSRGKKLCYSPIKERSLDLGIPVYTPNNLNDDSEVKQQILSLEADIYIVVAFGQILPIDILNKPSLGCWNSHASLLPKWRGAAPIQRSIMNLDNQTGISIMKIVEELDAGPVMHQDKIQINENIDTLTLSKVLSKLGANSILNAINKIEKGDARFQEQNHSEATYAKKISKMEGKINWKESAKKVLAKINGLNPNPGAWFEYNKERYKVWKAKIVNENSEAGKTIDNKLTIACKEQSIQILKIQKEGKKILSIKEFLLGHEIKKGETLN